MTRRNSHQGAMGAGAGARARAVVDNARNSNHDTAMSHVHAMRAATSSARNQVRKRRPSSRPRIRKQRTSIRSQNKDRASSLKRRSQVRSELAVDGVAVVVDDVAALTKLRKRQRISSRINNRMLVHQLLSKKPRTANLRISSRSLPQITPSRTRSPSHVAAGRQKRVPIQRRLRMPPRPTAPQRTRAR